jgi:hypothetical protein
MLNRASRLFAPVERLLLPALSSVKVDFEGTARPPGAQFIRNAVGAAVCLY